MSVSIIISTNPLQHFVVSVIQDLSLTRLKYHKVLERNQSPPLSVRDMEDCGSVFRESAQSTKTTHERCTAPS